ncbi:MAG: lysylphosphatidylglycerol synthase transmembrane domain-containing protein [Clostridiaceae bacterium]
MKQRRRHDFYEKEHTFYFMKKFLFKLFIVLSSALLLFILIFFTGSFDELVHIVKNAKAVWLAAGFGCMIAYWVIDASILHILALAMLERQPLKDSIRVTMIGQFFNAITPLSGAGQPVQAYVMVKDGVKPGHAASIIIVKTVLHQFVIVLYSIAAFVFKGSYFAANIPQFYYFFILGLLVNTAFLILYLLFLFNRQTAKRVLVFIFKVLRKLKFLKKLDKAEKKMDSELNSFCEGASILCNRRSLIIKLTVMQVLQFTFMFAIPYFIQLAVEKHGASLFNMLAAQSMITLISLLVPTPGATGGFEGLSYLFYGLFFTKAFIIPVILIYRVLTYYSSAIIGGLFTLLAPEKPLKRQM